MLRCVLDHIRSLVHRLNGNLAAKVPFTLRDGYIGQLNAKSGIRQCLVHRFLLGCLNILSVGSLSTQNAGGKVADWLIVFPAQKHLGFIDGQLLRNAQGLQLDSSFRMCQTEPQLLILQIQLEHFLTGSGGNRPAQQLHGIEAGHLVQGCHHGHAVVHRRYTIIFTHSS